MNLIAFYISDHGYGHAARNIPIIKNLLVQDLNINIIVKSSINQIQFIKQSLGHFSSRIAYYVLNTDLGLVLENGSISINKTLLLSKLNEFIDTWDTKIEIEKFFLEKNEVDLVVSDITPWIFKSCKLANVKSILISNFTWAEIYGDIFGYNTIYKEYYDCYQLADIVFIYPLAGDIEKYFSVVKKVGLSCREFSHENSFKIRKQFIKPIVYVSLGRSVDLQKEIDVDGLPYDFIYTEGIKMKGNNTHYIPVATPNTQDYILASDYIITKAGWGTIVEGICAQKPMLVIKRDEILEDRNTVGKLLELDIALSISIDQLNYNDILQLLEKLKCKKENYKFLSSIFKNCSSHISKEILMLL